MNKLDELLARMHHQNLATIDLGLERAVQFLELLGSPQKRLPPVIHVAGTNGKGSLLAYLNAIFEAAGYRVHRYVSPHLMRFNERIQLAGKPIDDAYLTALLERVAGFVDQQPVTFFESTTAAAFLAFAEMPADVLLLETGMGGRLDATNVVEKPVLTAVTPISRDHAQFLGDTVVQIAGEKAGILKPGVPCVVGRQTKDVLHVIKAKAHSLHAPLRCFHEDWDVVEASYVSKTLTLPLNPSLAGDHQVDNAATAVACIETLPQFNITPQQIQAGLANTVWPARLQHLITGRLVKILPKGMELWLDGGHNPQGGEILGRWLEKRGEKVHLVCGMIQGKESKAFFKVLAPNIASLHTIVVEGEETSQSAAELAGHAKAAGIEANTAQSVQNALQTIAGSAKTPCIVMICGSLYLAGKVLALNGE